MMFNELLSIISLGLLAAFLLFPYNSYRVDKIRQSIFELRDELFDDAAQGHISFESHAYRASRSLLNGVIRFSHHISFSRLIAHRFLSKSHLGRDDFTQEMNASPQADRQLCQAYIERANVLVINHVLSSPLVLMFVIPQVIVVVLSKVGIDVAASIVRRCRDQVADFDKIAFKEGQT